MADLVTHLCTGLLLKAVTGGRWVGPVALGTALPDISSRLPTMVLDGVIRMGVPLPLPVLYPWAVLHMPFGNLGLCGVLAFLFPKAQRAKVFLWLLIGSWLHFGVDLLQGHHGEGYYMFFPLSQARCELGVMGSEATVPFAPVLAAVTIVAWALRWHQKKGKKGSGR